MTYLFSLSVLLITVFTYQLVSRIQQVSSIKQIVEDKSYVYNTYHEWCKWNKPEDHVRYCKLWLFDRCSSSIIQYIDEYIDDEMLICNFVVKSNDINLNNIKNPSLGHIRIVQIDHDEEYKDIIHLQWYMNTLLNHDMAYPDHNLKLTLNSIIFHDNAWHIDLNGQWINITHIPLLYTMHNGDYTYTMQIKNIESNYIVFNITKFNGEQVEYIAKLSETITMDLI